MDSADPDPESGRPSWGRDLAVVAVFALLGSSVLIRSSILEIGTTAVVGPLLLASIGIGIALVVRWRRSAPEATDRSDSADDSSDADDAETDDSSDSSVWNAIPSWQYDGRHAESGGLTRGEQEQALREIQQEAEELSAESQETDLER